MELRSRITLAQQDCLILKVDPIDSLSIGKRMSPAAILRAMPASKTRSTTIGGMIFEAAVLSTLLSIGSEAGANNNENALVQALRQGSSQGLAQVGEQVVARSLNVQPTITIR